jgi:N-methylhydantoinase B
MTEKKIDILTLELLREALPSICDEMSVVLMRTGYNMFIYEVKDFAVSIVDANGGLIARPRGAGSISASCVTEVIANGIEEIGKENFAPGDIIIMNVPYITGQHLNNVTVYKPVFFKGELVCFTVGAAHWIDLGGSKIGLGFTSTMDVYQEGLQFRNLKVYDAGKPNKTFIQVIKDNCRRPDLTLGDFRACVGACNVGETRFMALLERYGLDTVKEAVRIITDQTEERTRKALAEIPDGVYEADSFLDGVGGQTVAIKIKVTIKGSDMHVDYTGCGPQAKGPINSTKVGLIAARGVVKMLTDPYYSFNQGTFRPVSITVPPGTFISAGPSAPMASWSIGLATVTDTILKAMAPAVPDSVPAGHKADQGDFGFYGTDPSTGKYWFAGSIRGGGHGGRPTEDGENSSVNILQGDIPTAPVEMLEQKFPLFVESYSLIQDSCGAGKFRGGLGSEWRIRPFEVDEVLCNIGGERYNCPPWGLWGGKAGVGNHYLLDLGDGKAPEIVLKRPHTRVPKGGWVALRSAGGGGWGNPLDRDATRVLMDVIRGYVSLEKATSDYGVVIDLAKKQIDEAATKALRERLRKEQGCVCVQ